MSKTKEAVRHIIEGNNLSQADRFEAEFEYSDAKKILKAPSYVEIVPGGEAMPEYQKDANTNLIETLKRNPSYFNLDASTDRLNLLDNADALALGIDLAETFNSKDSAVKMLCHQVAVCHNLAMKFAGDINRQRDIEYNSLDANIKHMTRLEKLVNISTRLMNTSERLIDRLQRLKTGGTQKITVEHVTVESGGQAIVGSQITGGNGGTK